MWSFKFVLAVFHSCGRWSFQSTELLKCSFIYASAILQSLHQLLPLLVLLILGSSSSLELKPLDSQSTSVNDKLKLGKSFVLLSDEHYLNTEELFWNEFPGFEQFVFHPNSKYELIQIWMRSCRHLVGYWIWGCLNNWAS